MSEVNYARRARRFSSMAVHNFRPVYPERLRVVTLKILTMRHQNIFWIVATVAMILFGASQVISIWLNLNIKPRIEKIHNQGKESYNTGLSSGWKLHAIAVMKIPKDSLTWKNVISVPDTSLKKMMYEIEE